MLVVSSEPSAEGEVACRARIRTKSAAAEQDHEGLGAFVSEKSAAAQQDHEGLGAFLEISFELVNRLAPLIRQRSDGRRTR